MKKNILRGYHKIKGAREDKKRIINIIAKIEFVKFMHEKTVELSHM